MPAACQGAQLLRRLANMGQTKRDVGEEALTRLRQPHLAMLAQEQGHAELPFQSPDSVGDGGLGHAELLPGGGKAADRKFRRAVQEIPAAERPVDVAVQVDQVRADPALEAQTTFSNNTGTAILRIAPEVVAGHIAAARKDWDKATLHLDRAIRYEDSLLYQEPHDWHAPVRVDLGNVLLAAGRPGEAEVAFWEDLKRNPENGWALTGLAAALKAQKKLDDLKLVEARLQKAWKSAGTIQ